MGFGRAVAAGVLVHPTQSSNVANIVPKIAHVLIVAFDSLSKTRVFLIETAEAKLETLVHQLSEYLRKQIGDYRDEPQIAEEQSAWMRAVEFFVGKP